ncbi:MAG: response regulator [Wenzhouxiangella sp.]|nr:response regulator [Wenzhouxiangella sp.]MCH8478414.1 response regulator [Wenzhouxiangella sp.]
MKLIFQAARHLISLVDELEVANPGNPDLQAWQQPIENLRCLLSNSLSKDNTETSSQDAWSRVSVKDFFERISVLAPVLSGQIEFVSEGFSPEEAFGRLDRLALDLLGDNLANNLTSIFSMPAKTENNQASVEEPAHLELAAIRLDGHRVVFLSQPISQDAGEANELEKGHNPTDEGSSVTRATKSSALTTLEPGTRKLIEAHGGTIEWVRVGTSHQYLSIGLPLTRLSDPGFVKARVHSKTILVVDDNPDIRFQTRQAIKHAYRVLEARDGLEALDKISKFLPDLLLVDIQMPRMNGFELVRKLRSQPETAIIPVVFLTSYGTAEYQIRAFASGGDQFIQKPFMSDVLLAQINRQFQSKKHLLKRIRQNRPIDSEPGPQSKREPLLNRIRALLRSNIDDADYDVDRLAGDLAMSRTALYQKLKAANQASPADLIRIFRLENAAYLLTDPSSSATEVSYAVGFRRLSAFSRAFKERYGMTPTEYKKQAVLAAQSTLDQDN